MDIIDQVLLYVAITFVVVAIGGVIAFAKYRKSFNYKIQIRKVVKDRKLIFEDFGKIIEDKDRNKWLKRLKGKKNEKLMPLPPDAAQEIDMKGKIHVIANLDEKGNYIYVTDNTSMNALETLNSNQRLALTSQIKKAQARKSFKWQEHIPLITSSIALVIIVLGFMIFFADVVEPTERIGENFRAAASSFEKVAEKLEALDSKIQVLADQEEIVTPEEAPQ